MRRRLGEGVGDADESPMRDAHRHAELGFADAVIGFGRRYCHRSRSGLLGWLIGLLLIGPLRPTKASG
jgi:hypothetical protein